MKQNVSLGLSVLLLLATGCTYNRVCYDPNTGFQTGGGVEIQCGGPLDPWMKNCYPQPCRPNSSCTQDFCCALKEFWKGTFCYPPLCAPYASPPCASHICSPLCAPPCAPNICPTPCAPNICQPTCASPVLPGGVAPQMPLPTAPAGPPVFRPTPQPTFAPATYAPPTYAPTGNAAPQSCTSCGQTPSVGGPVYPQPQPQPQPQPGAMPTPGVTNYPHLFQQQPQMAPPSATPGDQFQMPTPIPESEIPPTPDQLPPNYNRMDPPSAAPMQPMNPMQTMPPMNPAVPMTNPAPAPAQKPMPMPMPMGTPATQTSYPRHLPPGVMPSGMVQPSGAVPQGRIQDSRRQNWVPVRM